VERHVLDDAEDGDADLLEHLEPLAGVDQGDVLGRGDDDRSGHRHALGKRQLDVAGTGGQVHHQVIDVPPLGFVQQLLQRLGHHRSPPHHRGVGVDQETDRHGLDAVSLHRLEALAVARFRPAADAEHDRLRWAVNIGVENADARTLRRQPEREVDRGGALAHPALAGGDGDDVLDAGNQLDAALHGVRDDLHLHIDGDTPHVRDRLQRPGDLLPDRLKLALPRVTQQDFHRDLVPIHLDAAHRLGGDIILAGIRVNQLLQGFLNLLLRDCHGTPRSKCRARF
jgi:hypothetical protein